MRLDSFSNTNNTEASTTSLLSSIQNSFNNFKDLTISLVNRFVGVKNSSSEFAWKSNDSFSYSSQSQRFPVELRRVSSISSEGMTLTGKKSPESAQSTTVKSESAILNEKPQKTGFNMLYDGLLKLSNPSFWQRKMSLASDNVEQNKIAAGQVAKERIAVEQAMQANIAGICDKLNKFITDKNVEGIFRGEPNKAIYNKDDDSKLIKAFSNEALQSEPISLSWMVKTYLGEFFAKVDMNQFDDILSIDNSNPEALQQLDKILAQEDFDSLIKEKINASGSEQTQNNLQACFGSMAKALRLVDSEQGIQGLTKSSIVTSMLPRIIDITLENFISYNAQKEMITDLMVNYLTKYH